MSEIMKLFPEISEKHYYQDPDTGEFWFHATGVCNALGFTNVGRSLVTYTDEDERFQDLHNGRSVWFVSEAGCYGLIMAAKTETAKKFKRWLKHDVLPKLRADGEYVLKNKPSARNVSQKFLLADWREKRESGKLVRHEFTDMVKQYTAEKHPERQYPPYHKYTDLIYSGLFGTTSKNLRQLPVVEGCKIIGRNHLPTTLEIEGVAMAEDWTVRILEMAVKFHIPLAQMSLVRAIALSCAVTKTSLALPHLGKSQSRSKVLIEMCQDYRQLPQ